MKYNKGSWNPREIAVHSTVFVFITHIPPAISRTKILIESD